MDNIEQFIVDYIQRENDISDLSNVRELNFVEQGYVDSIGLIQFFALLEDNFGIEFSDEDMENEDVRVVGKLADIIRKKIGQ